MEIDDITLGRDLKACDIPLPERFSSVSRMHARLTRTINGVFLEDLSSTNGTFLDGVRVRRKKKVHDGQHIFLGGPEAGENVCELEISFNIETGQIEKTQKLTF